ncbi:MAG: hypothetical protein RL033_3203 [Pseudomonadota bacterium]
MALALLGLGATLQLTLYQWRVLPAPWEPFFGDGSRAVLDSWISRALPVNATLGTALYFLVALGTVAGGRMRWRSMPWLVVALGVCVVPFAVLSVLLVGLQPLVFHTWCTLCLVNAASAVLLVAPVLSEVLASLQHVQRAGRAGGSEWRAFWGLAPRGPLRLELLAEY